MDMDMDMWSCSVAEARDLPARQAPRVQLRVLLLVPRQRARRVDDEQADAVELYPERLGGCGMLSVGDLGPASRRSERAGWRLTWRFQQTGAQWRSSAALATGRWRA